MVCNNALLALLYIRNIDFRRRALYTDIGYATDYLEVGWMFYEILWHN